MPRWFTLLACVLFAANVAQAQMHPDDFDVPDGKIENAAGGHLMVSSKEMRATLKVQTEAECPRTVHLSWTDEGSVAPGQRRDSQPIRHQAARAGHLQYCLYHVAFRPGPENCCVRETESWAANPQRVS